MSTQIALHEPTLTFEDEAIVVDALRSKWVSTGGPYVGKFEQKLAEYVGAKYAISTSCGTVALQLILTCLARAKEYVAGFEVIVPTLTFIATPNAVIHAGGVPRFVDSNKNSLNTSAECIEQVIAKNYYKASSGDWLSRDTKLPLLAVMPAHIMGWCHDIDAIAKLCNGLGITLVEDAAEALGSREAKNQQHLGTVGECGAFSFNGNKILTTGGGGMVVTNNKKLADYMRHLSTTAKTNPVRFEHDEVGYNFRMVNLLAALGVSQLDKLPERIKLKRAISDHYKFQLNSHGIEIYDESTYAQGNHWLTNAVFDSQLSREAALFALNERHIQARPVWTPCHLQSAYAKQKLLQNTSFSNSEEMWRRTLSLPSSPHLSSSAIESICEIILNQRNK